MAEVTPIGGTPIDFQSEKVVVVADHDAATNEAVTTVYGITAGYIRISETPDGFLGRLGVSGNFAKLTRPNGNPVWINAKAVDTVRDPIPGEYIPAVHAVLAIGRLIQGVSEDAPTALAALRAHHSGL